MASAAAIGITAPQAVAQSAQDETAQQVQLVEQPLGDALIALSNEFGVTILANESLVRGLTAPALTARLDVETALRRILVGTSLTAVLSEPGTYIIAQQSARSVAPAEENTETLVADAIVVRGQLQERPLQETIESAVVVLGEDLERRGDLDILDAIERIPGVVVSPQERGFGIRGIGQRGPGGGGSNLVVSTQVDGATLTNLGTFSGPYGVWDLDQIEVLRGAQSTQQGRNALAGAVIIRTRDPVYEREFRLRGEYGSRDTVGGAFSGNLPLIDDVLALRLSVDTFSTDGFVENPTRGEDDYDRRELTNIRGKVRFDPTNNFGAIFSYAYTESERGENTVSLDFYPDERFNLSDQPSIETSEHNNFGLRLNWDASEHWLIESETNYYTLDYSRIGDNSRPPEADDGSLFDRTAEDKVFEQDLRAIYNGEAFNVVVGGFYTTIDSVFSQINQNPSPVPGFFVRTEASSDTTTENFAVFAEVELPITFISSDLRFVGGARYDRENVEGESVRRQFPTPDNPALPSRSQIAPQADTTFDAFLPKAALVYDWNDHVSTGLSVQRGYRAGGTSINSVSGNVSEFDPEFTWTYEASLRSEFFDDKAVFNANVFYVDWEDQQLRIPGPTGQPFDFDIGNAGESRLFGAELLFELDPTDDLSLFGSIALTDTEFLDADTPFGDFTGNEFLNAPRVTAAFGGEYFVTSRLSVGADASYTEESFVFESNNPNELNEERFLVNANIRYTTDNWIVGGYIRNLFDEIYATEIGTSRGAIPGEPFTAGVFLQLEY